MTGFRSLLSGDVSQVFAFLRNLFTVNFYVGRSSDPDAERYRRQCRELRSPTSAVRATRSPCSLRTSTQSDLTRDEADALASLRVMLREIENAKSRRPN